MLCRYSDIAVLILCKSKQVVRCLLFIWQVLERGTKRRHRYEDRFISIKLFSYLGLMPKLNDKRFI